MSIHLTVTAEHGPTQPQIVEVQPDQRPNFSAYSGLPYRRTRVPISADDVVVAADKGDIGIVDLRTFQPDGIATFTPILILRRGEMEATHTTHLPHSGRRYTFTLQRS